jgi:hypothetical protein
MPRNFTHSLFGIRHVHETTSFGCPNCVAERMCMGEDMDDVSLFDGYAVWSLKIDRC